MFSMRHISVLIVLALVDRCSCSGVRLIGFEGWLCTCVIAEVALATTVTSNGIAFLSFKITMKRYRTYCFVQKCSKKFRYSLLVTPTYQLSVDFFFICSHFFSVIFGHKDIFFE